MSLKVRDVAALIEKIGDVIEENKEFLTELDAAIGDGDHGLNMNKGFKVVKDKMNSTNIKDIGELFKLVGLTLIATVGGASGPLYGTAFMKGGMAVAGKTEVDMNDFIKIMDEAIKGIKMRGKAEAGDKTMIDALEPAFNALKEGVLKELPAVDILKNAREAALNGVNYTKEIAARKGRASYLGERSIGHQDAGATSSFLMIDAIYEFVKDNTKC
ncbi:dihydroxyacetone kinase subunit DhaL [Fonticella tunisiensis]|uniref:phosphoenolpyruvate--glycerone phosphotransferase n=1 Tax=Fonticella tunisiensis TaxID=1096341 RepID=A0A4R7KRW4_9CLOT|nr:dihydroxyacetone kinase subunit DhaL [Fonticella tunisiensis]TDT61363.1 dihydroxyacetone kinase DhaL subunit [Fonticella tunisiensis]